MSSKHQQHFMYVLECADGSLYTGYSSSVEQRVAAHNAGKGAKYTRSRGPVVLLAQASFETKHVAMSAEYRFKKLSRDEKDALLAQAALMPFEAVLVNRFPDLGVME
ncbi:MAG: GIY-YIG nuclease family protein [Raoultibacter sp.]